MMGGERSAGPQRDTRGPMQELQFRFLGFPVHVQVGFLFVVGIALVFGLQAQNPLWMIASFVGVIFVSILVHELGHALVSRFFGVRVEGIWIHGFGGEVRHAPCPLGQRIAISLAGPSAGLALGAVCVVGVIALDHPVANAVFGMGAFVNVFWSLFNLIPIYPMDGGQAMYASLHLVLAPRTAGLITFGTGAVLAVIVAILGWQAGFLFAALFAASFAWQNVQLFRHVQAVLPGAAREA